jgi:putative oxidoreductase
VAFAVGFARFWSYGAILLMHMASTASTYSQLLSPWDGERPQLLFWAAVPVLAAMIALFILRDRDRLLSIDAWRERRKKCEHLMQV